RMAILQQLCPERPRLPAGSDHRQDAKSLPANCTERTEKSGHPLPFVRALSLQRKDGTMKTNQICIETCNKLLRGELSAVETYQQAIAKFAEGGERPVLERILADHQDSVRTLQS